MKYPSLAYQHVFFDFGTHFEMSEEMDKVFDRFTAPDNSEGTLSSVQRSNPFVASWGTNRSAN